MLTVLHPEVRSLVGQFAGGLMPIRLRTDEKYSLIIKTQKEAILAAKMNGGFALYLPTLPSTTVTTTALVTAFFDDDDQPLIIRSPLFGDDSFSREILAILKYDEVDIYFFDDQNYEWMSFRTALEDGGSCLTDKEEIHLLTYHPETAKSVHQVLINWFGQRTRDDDDRAIQAVFKSELTPNDILVLDMTPEVNDYQGSTGFRHDSLTRTNPGYFQERDISVCLLRAFKPESIMMNPLRKDTFKEILDHLVLTESVAILIQAKDSPITEAGLSRSLDRKRRATRKEVDDAIRQINGAARYLGREAVARLVVGGKDVEVSIGRRQIIGLAIVKELFDDEGDVYATACGKLAGLSGGGLVMDYNSFHTFTHHFTSADAFISALHTLIARMRTGTWFPVKHAVLDGILDWIDNISGQKSDTPTLPSPR